jgi:hypothetical protein
MKPGNVILLEEAVEDLEVGRGFCDDKKPGVGAYFVTSLLSDIASLHLYSGVHPIGPVPLSPSFLNYFPPWDK